MSNGTRNVIGHMTTDQWPVRATRKKKLILLGLLHKKELMIPINEKLFTWSLCEVLTKLCLYISMTIIPDMSVIQIKAAAYLLHFEKNSDNDLHNHVEDKMANSDVNAHVSQKSPNLPSSFRIVNLKKIVISFWQLTFRGQLSTAEIWKPD